MVYQARIVLISAVLIASVPVSVSKADDVQVNTYTTGNQRFPHVAVDADGNAVVTWSSEGSSGTDSSEGSVQAQRYLANGSTLGDEFQVNTYTTDSQGASSVAMTPDGFVIVWGSLGSVGTDTLSSSVQGQRFAADGSLVGAQFQVNTFTPGAQGGASISADADGDFVVVWSSSAAAGDSSLFSVQGQRFTSDGEPAGEQFQVNTYTLGHQWSPAVAMADSGEFVVVWESHDEFGGGYYYYSIHARRYASDGTPIGSYFAVTANNGETEIDPAIDMDAAGNFIVVWRTTFDGLKGQRFGSNGSLIGDEFQVNTGEEYYPWRASVAMAPNGDSVVVWHNNEPIGGDTSGNSVRGRRFSSDGIPDGDTFEINTYTTDHQENAGVAVDDHGNFVVVWGSNGSGGTDTDEKSVQIKPSGLIFADGFESGDTSAWTNTSP